MINLKVSVLVMSLIASAVAGGAITFMTVKLTSESIGESKPIDCVSQDSTHEKTLKRVPIKNTGSQRGF